MPRETIIVEAVALVSGWYGKIPSLGDFASRRLPPHFIGAWDAWLQHSIAASRATLGSRWLDIYLLSPIWRFALLPGVIGEHAWAGLMMPSVDKVGRHFPLTFALPFADQQPDVTAAIFTAQDWYAAVEELALATLNVDFSLEQLERELAAHPFPLRPEAPPDPTARELAAWWQSSLPACSMVLPALQSMPDLLSSMGQALLSAAGQGKSLWWSGANPSAPAQLHGFIGLPPEERFAQLLNYTGVRETTS